MPTYAWIPNRQIQAGDEVLVTAGPFRGATGIVVEVEIPLDVVVVRIVVRGDRATLRLRLWEVITRIR